MKKTYIEPTMRTVALQRPNLLSGSGTLSDGNGLNMTISDTGADADADAREFGFDDEY